jgi:hypothetical protein
MRKTFAMAPVERRHLVACAPYAPVPGGEYATMKSPLTRGPLGGLTRDAPTLTSMGLDQRVHIRSRAAWVWAPGRVPPWSESGHRVCAAALTCDRFTLAISGRLGLGAFHLATPTALVGIWAVTIVSGAYVLPACWRHTTLLAMPTPPWPVLLGIAAGAVAVASARPPSTPATRINTSSARPDWFGARG